MQSGNSFSEWGFKNPSIEADQNRAIRLGQKMRCLNSSSLDLIACLRSRDAKSLMRAAGGIYGRYQIHVDGLFLEDTPTNLYRARDFIRCPIMAGYNKDEGTLTPYFSYGQRYRGQPHHPHISLWTAQNHVTRMMSGMGFTGSILRSAALEMYTNCAMSSEPDGDFFRSFVDVETDVYYACTTDKVLRAHDSTGRKIYKYVFTHEPTKSFFQFRDIIPSTPWLKAGHGEELAFVFGFPFIDELYLVRGHNVTEEEKALSVQMMRYWTNFAKTGDPNKSDLDHPLTDSIPLGLYSLHKN
ncbi:acetylcholinesterase-like [Strongylocentrotus purpuratus]|uniref:Carboxylesterase type B domain-containing protein n=1 Tax=Strongylocentrotus purpuratus TaxID=7668 RepID=A0A7M7NJ38_STRPU|nr:acetylcholinesterase-like [Strongylocentrotus purpuratus]